MHENKTFFLYKHFFLKKTGYFNIGFVSLQYKNTNQYWPKYSNKITEKSQILWNNFWKFFIFYIFLGLDPAGPTWLGWTQQASCEQWNIFDVNSESISLFTWIICDANNELTFHCSSELYFTWTVKCKEMVHAQQRRRCKPGGRNDVEDDGEHSQWCWWRWSGSRRGLPVVLTVELEEDGVGFLLQRKKEEEKSAEIGRKCWF